MRLGGNGLSEDKAYKVVLSNHSYLVQIFLPTCHPAPSGFLIIDLIAAVCYGGAFSCHQKANTGQLVERKVCLPDATKRRERWADICSKVTSTSELTTLLGRAFIDRMGGGGGVELTQKQHSRSNSHLQSITSGLISIILAGFRPESTVPGCTCSHFHGSVWNCIARVLGTVWSSL